MKSEQAVLPNPCLEEEEEEEEEETGYLQVTVRKKRQRQTNSGLKVHQPDLTNIYSTKEGCFDL
jgi:uncharacterized membrane-anchored protein